MGRRRKCPNSCGPDKRGQRLFAEAPVNSNSGTGTLTISTPTGVAAGDVMLAQVGQRSGSTFTAPAGWTLVRSDTLAGQIVSALYWRVVTTTEPTSHSWTSPSGGQSAGGIVAYRGVNTTNPVNAHAGLTGTVATISIPAVTTTVSNTMVVALAAIRQTTPGLPSATTALWQRASGNGSGSMGISGGDAAFSGPGDTGARTATRSTNSFQWTGQTVALRPHLTGGSPSVSASWTPTDSTFASGYKLRRSAGGIQQAEFDLSPRTQSSYSDTSVSAGTTYTYKLLAYYGNWTSTELTGTVTTGSC